MTYSVMISDEQRVALLKLLADAGLGGNNDHDSPLAYWVAMLTELPEMEKENPRVLHGLCL